MTSLVDEALMAVFTRLPRGGATLARVASQVLPGLRRFPARLPFGDFVLRGNVGQNVFYALAAHSHYPHQAGEDSVLAFLAQRSQVIVDVGANIGFTAALLASYMPKQGRILAFEPLPQCAPYLAQVAAHFPAVEVIAKAVGERSGVAEFLVREHSDRSSLSGLDDPLQSEPISRISVPVVTLDEAVGALPVDLLKVDVEGFEHQVFSGAANVLRTHAPYVVFETYLPELLTQIRAQLAAVDRGYRVFVILKDGSLRPLEQAHNRGGVDTCNFVAAPEGRAPLPDATPSISYSRRQ